MLPWNDVGSSDSEFNGLQWCKRVHSALERQGSGECFLRVRVWGILFFEGLFGFLLFVECFGCSCVLRGASRFFNKTLLFIKTKKVVSSIDPSCFERAERWVARCCNLEQCCWAKCGTTVAGLLMAKKARRGCNNWYFLIGFLLGLGIWLLCLDWGLWNDWEIWILVFICGCGMIVEFVGDVYQSNGFLIWDGDFRTERWWNKSSMRLLQWRNWFTIWRSKTSRCCWVSWVFSYDRGYYWCTSWNKICGGVRNFGFDTKIDAARIKNIKDKWLVSHQTEKSGVTPGEWCLTTREE